MDTITDNLAPPVRYDGRTPARRQVFFETLSAGHTVSWACARLGPSRQAVYKARARDAAFAQAWHFALEKARQADLETFLEALPENLHRTLSTSSTLCELGGARTSAQDTVNPINTLPT